MYKLYGVSKTMTSSPSLTTTTTTVAAAVVCVLIVVFGIFCRNRSNDTSLVRPN